MNIAELTCWKENKQKKAAALIARSQGVVEDCARLRDAQPVPMTIAEAIELADYMARVHESVVSSKRLVEAILVLAVAVKGLR